VRVEELADGYGSKVGVERPGAEEWVPHGSGVPGLRAAVPHCRGCELWEPATQAVFSSGPADARLMLVGEQPGDQEDRKGVPFVGPAGRLLVEALEQAGIDAGTVYLTNAVKHFRFTTRGKRRIHEKPGAGHVDACLPWLAAELAAVRPQLVVCLGATAARAVLAEDVKVTAVRGLVRPLVPYGGLVMVTVHPSAVLRLRGRDGWQEAYAAFVEDLRTADRAAVAGEQPSQAGGSGPTERPM
jgi:uracil-DNA glycosylase